MRKRFSKEEFLFALDAYCLRAIAFHHCWRFSKLSVELRYFQRDLLNFNPPCVKLADVSEQREHLLSVCLSVCDVRTPALKPDHQQKQLKTLLVILQKMFHLLCTQTSQTIPVTSFLMSLISQRKLMIFKMWNKSYICLWLSVDLIVSFIWAAISPDAVFREYIKSLV